MVLLRIPLKCLRHNVIDLTTEVGKNTFMRNSTVGKWCYIGPNGIYNNVVIGNYTCIAPSCQIGGMEHSYWTASISPLLSDECVMGKRTTIGHDVWIAANCIIRQGVSIGDGAVIGAHSFVNQDIPPYAIAFGTPAKIHKYRFDKATIEQLDHSRYWEQKPHKAKEVLSNMFINKL